MDLTRPNSVLNEVKGILLRQTENCFRNTEAVRQSNNQLV